MAKRLSVSGTSDFIVGDCNCSDPQDWMGCLRIRRSLSSLIEDELTTETRVNKREGHGAYTWLHNACADISERQLVDRFFSAIVTLCGGGRNIVYRIIVCSLFEHIK